MTAEDRRVTGDEQDTEGDLIDKLATSLPPKDLRTLLASGHTVERALAEEHLRRRAYDLWDAAGRPPGDGIAFWVAAEREVLGEDK